MLSLGLFNSLWSRSLSNWILRGGHICLLSLAQARHKESSVCLDENVDGRDVMHAKGTLRRRGCVLDVLRRSVLHWGASGVCLVSLKALTPPLPPFCIFIHLRCCSPHSTITLPLLNIYGSQETRSQHQLFYSHTFFLIASASAFATLSFMVSFGGNLRLLQSFYCWSDKELLCGFTHKATVPSCAHERSLQQTANNWIVVLNISAYEQF